MKNMYEFRIMHDGWETDNKGWIIDIDGRLNIRTTNHGSDVEMNRDYLLSKIIETEQSLAGLRKAAELMGYTEKT